MSIDYDAMTPDEVANEMSGSFKRTPYNIVSAMIALSKELEDLNGPDAIEDFYSRGPGISAKIASKSIEEYIGSCHVDNLDGTQVGAPPNYPVRAAWIEFGMNIIKWALKGAEHDALPELFTRIKFGFPNLVAQLFMQHLNSPLYPMTSNLVLDWDDKKFWLEVAEYMGPDYIDYMKKVAAFMSRVDDFR